MPVNNRFITYRLGDNDFGGRMQRAAEFLYKFFGTDVKTVDTGAFREAMASHIAGESIARHRFEGDKERSFEWYFEYLNNARVERGREAADCDRDYGAVSIDTSTGYIWTH